MKKLFYTAIVAFTILLSTNNTQAQAWSKDTKVLGIGIGGSTFFHISNTYYASSFYQPVTGQLNFTGEFGVHDYVGIGFTTGFGGRPGYSGAYGYGYYGGRYNYGYPELNVPVGVIANFHFFQLIADKSGKDIHADKLDVYAGVNAGGGIAVLFGTSKSAIVPIAFGGVQAGARYYFTDKFGVNAEVGFPKLIHGGVVFKL